MVQDPDGDGVTREWSVYEEASTVASEPGIRLAGRGTAENAFVTVDEPRCGRRCARRLDAARLLDRTVLLGDPGRLRGAPAVDRHRQVRGRQPCA